MFQQQATVALCSAELPQQQSAAFKRLALQLIAACCCLQGLLVV
jgi:hypothetical protein